MRGLRWAVSREARAYIQDELRRTIPPLDATESDPDPRAWVLCCAEHKIHYVALTVM